MILPDYCKVPMKILEAEGYEIFIVGGAVRDILRGVPPHDFDAATSATPEQVRTVMERNGIPCINEKGVKHGTVTVLYDGNPFEITTYRKDGDYSDSRHPDSVEFTSSIDEDVKRRDFTINAMYLDKGGNVTDPTGGREDLQNKIIRAVGDPDKRFSEDALRILRGLRFAARFGMTIEKDTAAAMRKNAHLLHDISVERILCELTPVMISDNAGLIIREYSDILSEVILSVGKLGGYADLFDKIPGRDAATGFAILFYGTDVEAASGEMARLKFPTALCRDVTEILNFRGMPLPADAYGVRLMRAGYPEDSVRRILLIREALGEDISFVAKTLLECGRDKIPSCVRELAIDGEVVISLGAPKGRAIGNILDKLFDEVLKGQILNDKEVLSARAERIIEKKEY